VIPGKALHVAQIQVTQTKTPFAVCLGQPKQSIRNPLILNI